MEEGDTIEYYAVTGWWKDTGTPEDIIHVNKLILDSIGTEHQFLLGDRSQLKL